MNQQYDEDKKELEAHFEARVQSYVELGESPEQAVASAREKFGETETLVRELSWQQWLRSPIIAAVVGLLGAILAPEWLALQQAGLRAVQTSNEGREMVIIAYYLIVIFIPLIPMFACAFLSGCWVCRNEPQKRAMKQGFGGVVVLYLLLMVLGKVPFENIIVFFVHAIYLWMGIWTKDWKLGCQLRRQNAKKIQF